MKSEIEAFDADGQRVMVPREIWRAEVLPAKLRAAWHDPDRLAHEIARALRDGFAEEPASRQLLALEPASERAHNLRAEVLLALQRPDEAEAVLKEYSSQHGITPAILTNLSKVYAFHADSKRVERSLWSALQIDPNYAPALNGWLATQSDQRGALTRAAALPGSWRPKLGLACLALEKKHLVEARDHYEDVLAVAPDEPDALMIMSGDLGRFGRLNEAVSWVMPRYKPSKHRAGAGYNLLEVLIRSRRYVEASQLLNEMEQQNWRNEKQRLESYRRRISPWAQNA